MEMKKTRVEVLFRAEQPLHQGKTTIGNHSELNTFPVVQRDGAVADVPGISADAMRHMLRERMSTLVLDASGLNGTLTAEALRLLFNGGIMAGGTQGAVKLREMRELGEAMPHMALLGGCTWNQIIPGKMQVENAMLVCDETAHIVPRWMLDTMGYKPRSARMLVAEEQRVRSDSLGSPSHRALLSSGARDEAERRIEARETASVENNAKAISASKGGMLPRTCDVIVQGALLSWSVTATTHSVIEEDAFWTMLCAFLADSVVGGKSGSGHGRIAALAANQIPIARPLERAQSVDLATIAPNVGERFRRHTEERRADIARILSSVTA